MFDILQLVQLVFTVFRFGIVFSVGTFGSVVNVITVWWNDDLIPTILCGGAYMSNSCDIILHIYRVIWVRDDPTKPSILCGGLVELRMYHIIPCDRHMITISSYVIWVDHPDQTIPCGGLVCVTTPSYLIWVVDHLPIPSYLVSTHYELIVFRK